MSSLEKGKKLFEEFPPISTQEWEEKIIKDLKGADYDKKLVWKTNEGFNVRPYYRAEDLKELGYLDALPTDFPYVRGVDQEKNTWYIRQTIQVSNELAANKKALELVKKGVNSFAFVLERDKPFTASQINALLSGLPLNEVEINFIAGMSSIAVAKELLAYAKAEDATDIKGSFVYDPVMCLAKKGKACSVNPFADAAEIIKITEALPNFKAITVRGDIVENAGSSISQELGYSIAAAHDYVANLLDLGLSIDQIAPKIKFSFATGSNYFMELAKIRAARLLWAQVVNQYEPKNANAALANIHATTSDWNKTVYDPYVNMLRTQTEAMSSILGGVDSMEVKPFNAGYESTTDFSERIARNQQILLKEEAHFDKVVDPGAGSYYIEHLTDSIASQAWDIFIATEDKGGFHKALLSGDVQKAVKEMAQKRDMDIANRKENFLGVSQFPNFNESLVGEVDAKVFETKTIEGTEVEPLGAYRGAQAIEAMRFKTDSYAKDNKRPLAFMLTIGNLNMRKARAQFACNFFAVAGFEVQDNNGFDTVEAGIAAAKEAKADVIVICSSDDEYAEYAPQLQANAGDAITVVAGYPKAIMDDLKAKGLKHFIHVKSNLIDTLTGFQKELGII